MTSTIISKLKGIIIFPFFIIGSPMILLAELLMDDVMATYLDDYKEIWLQ